MLRIGLCDDEARIREGLRFSLQRLIDEDEMKLCIYDFSSGEGVLHWLEKHPDEMDILFLDIEMSGLNGMETAARIRAQDNNLIIVFVTGYTDYVFDGYGVNALDYLVKPVKQEKLAQVVKRAIGAMQQAAPSLFTLQNTQGIFRVPKKDILYFYSDRRQVILVSKNKEYSFYEKLDQVQEQVGTEFIRIHKRFLVQADGVDSIEANALQIGDTTLPISRACHKEAMTAFARRMFKQQKG